MTEAIALREFDDIDGFFSLYPSFPYKRERPIHAEFYRMCDTFKWYRQQNDGNYPVEREEARDLLRIAIVKAFNSIVGTDPGDLESWKRICKCLRVAPIPETSQQAKEKLKNIHVNLVDLLESVRMGTPVQSFTTMEELRQYTVTQKKFFPKEEAYEGGLLRYLLREILNKYEGLGGKKKQKGSKSRRPLI
ncbi:hypothetical protein N7476_004645 [Penicillium atrosanguineum]|uniref:Uncharacterized protein n=1 Tax=Penicillium atrosanguineum TaxID=1132637 RepID=A0A9W9Q143_9EURO|nr:hypothetical protein N7476_004645 [Penicillium atrosanguineum]